jgi:hypothetical protein
MTQERKTQFIQFSFLFLFTAAVLLLALFLTRDTAEDQATGGEEEQLYTQFRNFDKLKPGLIRLIDTVSYEANLMASQNAGNTNAINEGTNFIERFDRYDNTQSDAFAARITEMLRQYLQTSAETKTDNDRKKDKDEQLQECLRSLPYPAAGQHTSP